MEIDGYIRELLFREDCVIIPGFGGFVSNYRPARIQRESHTFTPPMKEIGFNPDLNHADFMLADEVAEQEGISREEARSEVDQYVARLKQKLANGDRVFVEGVGSFALDLENEIRFSADLGVNFLMDAFGLMPFHLKEIPSGESVFSRSPLFRQDEKPVQKAHLPGTPEIKMPKGKQLRRIAIAVPFLAVLTLLPLNSRVSQILTQHPVTLSPLPSLYQLDYPKPGGETMPREIIYPIRQDTSEQTATTPTQPVEPEKKTTDFRGPVTGNREPGIGKYPIIAGSFKTYANADKLVLQLKASGYPAQTIPAANGYIRVSVNAFDTWERANQEMTAILRKEPSMQLWIPR